MTALGVTSRGDALPSGAAFDRRRFNRIGVAIPTYRREALLGKMLNSIPERIAIGVSDNGDTLTDRFKHEHSCVVFDAANPIVPVYANWNKAVRLLTTEWVVVPSDDDLYLEGAFDIVESSIARHPDAEVLVFGHNNIDGDERILGSWLPDLRYCLAPSGFHLFRYGVAARMPCVFIRRRLFDRLGGFNEDMKLTACDSELVQRATLLGNTLYVPEIIASYRMWEGGLTAQRTATAEWMHEVDQWCANMRDFDVEHRCGAWRPKFGDDIVLQNLIAGVRNVRRQSGRFAAWRYFVGARWPLRARAATYARLLRQFL